MKGKTTIIIFGIVILFILIYNGFQNRSIVNMKKVDSTNTWTEQEGIEELVLQENETAREFMESTEEEGGSSQTSTEETPKYTKMFPDLYTVYGKPAKLDKTKKVVYLTFDDGPSENTYKVLDILEEENIHATFFLVGSEIGKKEEASLKRMVNEGHTIGIHTYSHMCDEIYCSVERYLDDFNTVYQQIYDITGMRVNIYRFPWGSNNRYGKRIKGALMDEMQRRGFSCYDWNVDTKDSIGRPSAYSIKRNIAKDLDRQTQPIILMHDSGINDLSANVLPDIIKMIRDKGYEFDTLDHREPYQFP